MNELIGILDSGIGGLSIVSSLIKALPQESFVYIADSKNCPYGQKTSEEIFKLTTKMIDFLIEKKIKLLVVACNTITVTSIERLRESYPNLPIVGIVPVIKTAVKTTKNKKIGIFSTLVTSTNKYQKDLISEFAKDYFVLNLGSEDLVSKIEKRDLTSIKSVLSKELQPFKDANIDTLVLGCSHFSLIEPQIQEYLPSVTILDSKEAVVRQIKKILKQNKLLSKNTDPSYNFYTTGDMQALRYFSKKMTNKAKLSIISLHE